MQGVQGTQVVEEVEQEGPLTPNRAISQPDPQAPPLNGRYFSEWYADLVPCPSLSPGSPLPPSPLLGARPLPPWDEEECMDGPTLPVSPWSAVASARGGEQATMAVDKGTVLSECDSWARQGSMGV